jgi:2-amino-4-hydroxy-6-hydroxymethyldihydropteridine diphosphokinase
MGSNVERRVNIRSAIASLRGQFGELILSPVYESAAIGFPGDHFYNLVVGLRTDLDPHGLRTRLAAIESQHGRTPDTPRYAPRPLDLDILLYDDLVIRDNGLDLPRKDITRYAFVLRPLADIAGEVMHPLEGRRIRELWAEFDKSEQALAPVPHADLLGPSASEPEPRA